MSKDVMTKEITDAIDFAIPFAYGLTKIRDAAARGEGVMLTSEETSAVLRAIQMLRGPQL